MAESESLPSSTKKRGIDSWDRRGLISSLDCTETLVSRDARDVLAVCNWGSVATLKEGVKCSFSAGEKKGVFSVKLEFPQRDDAKARVLGLDGGK